MQRSVDGESINKSSILFSLGLMGLFLPSQFFWSWCPRRHAHLVLKSCTTNTQTSEQASTPQRVLNTDGGFKSKIFHANENSSTLNLSTKTQSFGGCLKCTPMQNRTAGVFAEWATFAVEDVQGFALLDTGASRTVGGYTMVQYVIPRSCSDSTGSRSLVS